MAFYETEIAKINERLNALEAGPIASHLAPHASVAQNADQSFKDSVAASKPIHPTEEQMDADDAAFIAKDGDAEQSSDAAPAVDPNPEVQ